MLLLWSSPEVGENEVWVVLPSLSSGQEVEGERGRKTARALVLLLWSSVVI